MQERYVTMSIGIVIPTYNRLDNLQLTLDALAQQTMKDFHVVVADSGSNDGTRTAIECIAQQAEWKKRLRWVGCGPYEGYRVARTKNIGVANLPEDCTFLVLLDSDVILEPHALEIYAKAYMQQPQVIIMGVLDWLPPLSLLEITDVLQSSGVAGLRRYIPTTWPKRVEGTTVGRDIRPFARDIDTLQPLRTKWSLINNAGMPLDVFRGLGGFDEYMTGYGYDDLELGIRAYQKGISCLLLEQIWALHIWHPKENPVDRLLESQRNLDYVLRKHGSNEDLEEDIDWRYWGHYHRVRGGRVMSIEGDVWAISSVGIHRIRLPTFDWLERLGYCPSDLIASTAADLARIELVGEASEIL